MAFRLDIIRGNSVKDIEQGVRSALKGYEDLLPASKDARILLKPNMNSNMNALTGNTTDLRIVAAVIKSLKDYGYTSIKIGEGTNSGYYRYGISVISRLAFDRLAAYYGAEVVDLNYSDKVEIEFEDGVRASVARECVEADLFINMPKLKTHFEAGMSVCLKNLMGCLVGQENKKKTHQSLARNIININKRLKPHLHIVDGLIAMEGLGPTRGTPINTGTILVGTDPCLIDLACARIADFDYRKVKTLKLLEDDGVLTKDYHEFVKNLDLSGIARKFKEPKANPFASFIHSPKRQRYFLAVRNTALFSYLCSTKSVGYLLYLTGLRQDNFIEKESSFEEFSFNKDLCKEGCTMCADYCPIELNLPNDLLTSGNNCIECMYCFLVCPTNAIGCRGELGFMNDLIKQYGDIIKKTA